MKESLVFPKLLLKSAECKSYWASAKMFKWIRKNKKRKNLLGLIIIFCGIFLSIFELQGCGTFRPKTKADFGDTITEISSTESIELGYLDSQMSDLDYKIKSNPAFVTTNLCLNNRTCERLNVMSFGAKGDDNDDTISIKNAFGSVSSSGDVVYFPKGIYVIDEAITVKKGTRIEAQKGAILKAKDSASIKTAMLNLTGDYITIIGLTVDGNKANNDNPAVGYVGVYIRGNDTKFIRVHNVNVKNCPGSNISIGVHGNHPHDIWIDRVISEDAGSSSFTRGGNGLSITDAKRVWITNSRFTGAALHGIDMEPNNATDWLAEIYLVDVFVDNNSSGGIQILGKTYAADQGHVYMHNPHIFDNKGNGLILTQTRDISVYGGKINGNRSSGVYLSKSVAQLTMKGTEISENNGRGIQYSPGAQDANVAGFIFEGLDIRSNRQFGIQFMDNALYTIHSIVIAKCHIYGHTTAERRPIMIESPNGNLNHVSVVNNIMHNNTLNSSISCATKTVKGNVEW